MQALIRASEINRDSLSKFIGEIVTKCALLSNFSMDAIKINIIVQELAKDIQTRFRLLELPEIEKAFDEGCKYGDANCETDGNTRLPNKLDYISNLKLNI